MMKGILRSAHQIPAQPQVESQISNDLVILLKVGRVVVEQESVIRYTARIERKCRSSQEKRREAAEKLPSVEVLTQRITDCIRPGVGVLLLEEVCSFIRTNSETQHFEAVNVVGHVVARTHDAQLVGGHRVVIRYLTAEI